MISNIYEGPTSSGVITIARLSRARAMMVLLKQTHIVSLKDQNLSEHVPRKKCLEHIILGTQYIHTHRYKYYYRIADDTPKDTPIWKV